MRVVPTRMITAWGRRTRWRSYWSASWNRERRPGPLSAARADRAAWHPQVCEASSSGSTAHVIHLRTLRERWYAWSTCLEGVRAGREHVAQQFDVLLWQVA